MAEPHKTSLLDRHCSFHVDQATDDALRAEQARLEREGGIKLSRGEAIRAVLRKGLATMATEAGR